MLTEGYLDERKGPKMAGQKRCTNLVELPGTETGAR